MITKEDAEKLLHEHINQVDPNWPDKPEMVITSSEEREVGWLIYWTSSTWLKTNNIKDAIAGNGPYLVSHDGELHSIGSAFVDERIVQVEEEIKDKLERGSGGNVG